MVDIDKDRLRNASGFEKDNWPDMGNASWGSQIYRQWIRAVLGKRNKAAGATAAEPIVPFGGDSGRRRPERFMSLPMSSSPNFLPGKRRNRTRR